MNTFPAYIPDLPDDGETIRQLQRLCEMQTAAIHALRERLDAAEAANHTLSTELLEASEARAQALVSIQHQASRAREMTECVVKERDTVVTALRNLRSVCPIDLQDMHSDAGCKAFDRAVTEADDLLTLIDRANVSRRDENT